MNDKLCEIYSFYFDQFKQNKRLRFSLDTQALDLIQERLLFLKDLSDWKDKQSAQELNQILFLLYHHGPANPSLALPLLAILRNQQKQLDSDYIVFSLNVLEKHLIGYQLREGEMFNKELIEILKLLLQHKSSEVNLWTLKSIESLGPRGFPLFADLLKKKRPIFTPWWNKHKIEIKKSIDWMLNSWGKKNNANSKPS